MGVQALGAFTPAGTGVPEVMAALRLSTQVLDEVETPQGETVSASFCPFDLDGEERLAALALSALAEASGVGPLKGPIPLLLCAPEPEAAPWNGHLLLDTIVRESGFVDPSVSAVVPSGRAAVFQALVLAEKLFASGRFDECFLGAAESLILHPGLGALIARGRVLTEGNQTGFIPGEGAAFVRLRRTPNEHSLAMIRGLGTGRETNRMDSGAPATASGLIAAARRALESGLPPGAPVGLYVTDHSGERYFASELALAGAALGADTPLPSQPLLPAMSVGDIGAAVGPLSLAAASFFLRNGVGGATNALVLGASDSGLRGAAVLSAVSLPAPGGLHG